MAIPPSGAWPFLRWEKAGSVSQIRGIDALLLGNLKSTFPMPEYDYHCQNCQSDFTVELSIAEHETKDKKHEIRGPKCDITEVRHVIAAVSDVTSRKS
jgi:hypothetical protein